MNRLTSLLLGLSLALSSLVAAALPAQAAPGSGRIAQTFQIE